MKKPERLKQGDTIAVISPSLGLPSIFPHVFDKGLENLKSMGFNVKEYPTTREDIQVLKNNPKIRANDINDAFKDPEVKGIITSIGGDDAIRVLPYIDINIIKENPKFFMGYSDISIFNTYFTQNGIETFNGPTIMAGYSQMETFGNEYFNEIKSFLLGESSQNYEYNIYSYYAEENKDWTYKENAGKMKELIPNSTGWQWLQGNNVVEGELFGGCLEVLEMMKSTQYWPSLSFWKNKIFFLETSEEKPSPAHVKAILRNYAIQGIFDNISALLIGRPKDYSEDEKEQLKNEILDLLNNEFKNYTLPVVMNMDFGHTEPQFILPLGIKAEINCDNKSFRLIESIFDN